MPCTNNRATDTIELENSAAFESVQRLLFGNYNIFLRHWDKSIVQLKWKIIEIEYWDEQ